MGTLLKYLLYAFIVVVIYLIGVGFYKGTINKDSTVGQVTDNVAQGTKEIISDGYQAAKNAAQDGFETTKDAVSSAADNTAEGYQAAKENVKEGYQATKNKLSDNRPQGGYRNTNGGYVAD